MAGNLVAWNGWQWLRRGRYRPGSAGRTDTVRLPGGRRTKRAGRPAAVRGPRAAPAGLSARSVRADGAGPLAPLPRAACGEQQVPALVQHPGMRRSSTAPRASRRKRPRTQAQTSATPSSRLRCAALRLRRSEVAAGRRGRAVLPRSVRQRGGRPAAETARGAALSSDRLRRGRPPRRGGRNTSPSSSELLASLLAPWAPVQATSPAAYSPGTEVRPPQVGGHAAHPVVGRRGHRERFSGPVVAGGAGGGVDGGKAPCQEARSPGGLDPRGRPGTPGCRRGAPVAARCRAMLRETTSRGASSASGW